MNRKKPSRFKAFVSAFALGSSLCFAQTSAWAVCTGGTDIITNVIATELIASDLCSFTVQNSGGISTASDNNYGIQNSIRAITSLSNYGSISTNGNQAHSVLNFIGTITSLKNTGSITAAGSSSNAISNDGGTITTLTNTGTISAPNGAGISNYGAIGTLNNQQGGSSPLTYSGRLPANYNIMIGSSTNYGKLSVTSPTNALGTSGITFNIYGNTGTTLVSGVPASTLAAGTYSGVIIGLSISNIITGSGFSVTGTFPGGYSWELIQTSIASGIWDLVVTENLPQNTLSAVATSNSISVTGTSTLSTNGGSGSGNVTYALVSGPCSLSGSTLTGTGVGNCVVTATKAADSTYVSATSAQLTVAVSLATQTTLGVAASTNSIPVFSSSSFSTTGGNGSGNVSYSLVSGPCSLSGSTLTGTGVGNCVVTATKAADSTYASATSAPLTVSITAAPSSPNTIGPGSSAYVVSLVGGVSNPVLSGGTLVLASGDSSSVSISITSSGGTIQAPASGSAVLSGVFSGSGGLTFTGTGTGTTILSGTNTYSGGTTVSSGTLVVSGSLPTGTGDVFVASAGSLMGTGTIAGNGLISGVLKPGNSPGYLSMLQNLTLNSGATFIEDIAGTTPSSSATPVGATGYYAVLNVVGQLIIDSGTTLTPRLSNLFSPSEPGFGSPIYVPVLGNVFRMITTTGGISGRFTTLTQPAELSSGTQLLAFYNVNNSKSIDLAVVPTSYSTSLAGGTPSVMSAASVLDQWVLLNKAGTATAAQNQLLFGVASQSAANLSAYVQANAAEILATAAATAPIPTLSEWAMMLLVSLMGMLGLVRMRRGRRPGFAGDIA